MLTLPTAPSSDDHVTQRVDWYFALFASLIVCSYGIVAAVLLVGHWPTATKGDAGITYAFPNFYWGGALLTPDKGFLLLSAAGAMLGSTVHCLGAIYSYCGKRKFDRSWIFFYVFSPIAAAILGMGTLWILRGSLVSAQTASESSNPNGVAGIAFLIGLFSRDAINKLQSIAANVFSIPAPPKPLPSPAPKPTPHPGTGGGTP